MSAIRYLVRPNFANAILMRSETKNPSQIKQIDFWPVRVEVGDFSWFQINWTYYCPISKYTILNIHPFKKKKIRLRIQKDPRILPN